MRIFKHKRFGQWAKHEGILDSTLKKAAHEILNGLFDAYLGGGLYKKRVARAGQGKRGAYRTLVAFNGGDRSIFVFGFAKNERSNIGIVEKQIFKRLAKDYLNATDEGINRLIQIEELLEVR